MKTYRLKDVFGPFDRGAEFIDGKDGLLISIDSPSVMAKIPTDLLNEVGDGVYWKPIDGELFYYIDEDGDVSHDIFDPTTSALDMAKLSLGNCFKTEKDAQAVVDWLEARQNIIKSGARFINSSDPTVNDSRRFYTVYLTMNDTKLRVDDAYFSKDVVRNKVMCFDDRGKALKSIEEYRDDWLTYLGR